MHDFLRSWPKYTGELRIPPIVCVENLAACPAERIPVRGLARWMRIWLKSGPLAELASRRFFTTERVRQSARCVLSLRVGLVRSGRDEGPGNAIALPDRHRPWTLLPEGTAGQRATPENGWEENFDTVVLGARSRCSRG
jgi:hypothetical protein